MLSFVGSIRNTPRRGGKSLRLSNPVLALLSLVKAIPSTRNYRLQVLLFLIDRHWKELPVTIQSEICTTLSSFLSQDDHLSASWAFACCAAIACAHEPSKSPAAHSVSDEIVVFWSNAIRRTSVALECRAACHAANAIAQNGHLDSLTLYKDIETFATDLLFQGPAFPHDSVCAFLVECLRFASRDVRLFRKQLEDKVLGWVSETWNVTEVVRNGTRTRLDTHSPADVLELLQVSCALTRCIIPLPFALLPDCTTTEILLDRQKTSLIRDYIVHARLPKFQYGNPHPSGPGVAMVPSPVKAEARESNLMAPSDRARKSSAFLLKSLDTLLAEWESAKDAALMSREAARRAADFVCLALWFEASLESDGMRSNTRVIKTACALARKITPCLSTSRWTPEERVVALLAYDTIINDGEESVEYTPWQGILDPDVDTGIKRRALAQMMHRERSAPKEQQVLRRELLRKIWQWAEVCFLCIV
jgi:ataxia telangiectasia mutated family protein